MEIEEQIKEEQLWDVLDCYFEDNGLVKQQVDSYNRFCFGISEVIR